MKKAFYLSLMIMFISIVGSPKEALAFNSLPTTTLTFKKTVEIGVPVLQNGQYILIIGVYELEITATVNEFTGFQSIQSFKVNKIYSPSISINDKEAWIDISSNNGIISWAVWLTNGTAYSNTLGKGNITLLEFYNGASSGPGGPPRI